jgi:glycosyltransferase involved in cell wall biosynthesis
MKVLLTSLWSISNASIGGTEKFVVDLANLLSMDHDVTVLSLGTVNLNNHNIKTISLELVSNLNEYSLSKYLEDKGLHEIVEKIRLQIDGGSFDVVHCNSLIFAGLIENVPVIHTVHTNEDEFKSSFSHRISNIILTNVLNDSESVYVTPSLFANDSFNKLTGKKSAIIFHGFNSDITISNNLALRNKYGILEKEIVFCVPSRLELKQKGQDILLNALVHMEKLLPPFAVVLGGCDKQYIDVKESILTTYKNFKIVIEGFSNKNDMYSLADIVVLPSKTESFGYAALESAMLGLLVFLSDIPPYREIAMNNKRIIQFKNDYVSLAKVLTDNLQLIKDHKIVQPPLNWSERYSKELMLRSYVDLYKKSTSNF